MAHLGSSVNFPRRKQANKYFTQQFYLFLMIDSYCPCYLIFLGDLLYNWSVKWLIPTQFPIWEFETVILHSGLQNSWYFFNFNKLRSFLPTRAQLIRWLTWFIAIIGTCHTYLLIETYTQIFWNHQQDSRNSKFESNFYCFLLFPWHLQVSVGTLLAFTMVAISVLILRYVPPDEVPLTSSLQDSIDPFSLQSGSSTQDTSEQDSEVTGGSSKTKPLIDQVDISVEIPLISTHVHLGNCKFSTLFLSCGFYCSLPY